MSHAIEIWLLPFFFLLIGVELRNEVRVGVFKKRTDLLIPFSAAIFGVLFPFLIYRLCAMTFNIPNSGWGVVVATDLPLALFALKFFKNRAQRLRPYLLSLAIFDDLISIILIALIYHKNGIHPTVIGFVLGLLIPIRLDRNIFRVLSKFSNFFIIPAFIIATVVENFTFKLGLVTLAVLVSRILGKPIGILFGDFIAGNVLKSQILIKSDLFLIGIIASLGLSVSLLFVNISSAPPVEVTSVLVAAIVALSINKVISKVNLTRS